MYTFEEPRVREIAQRIHDWWIGRRLEVALTGVVSGHPEVGPGPVVTSGLYYLDPIAGYARTLSRWYKLGNRKD